MVKSFNLAEGTKLLPSRIDNPELLKFTGKYIYNPYTQEAKLAENYSNLHDRVIADLRETEKKSPYKANSNELYRKVNKTLNLVNRMYDSVYTHYSKQYPELIKGRMPSITVSIVDRTFILSRDYYGEIKVNTRNSLGTAYYNSNKINLKTSALRSYQDRRVENLIMHELGHGVFGLRHCKKRKNTCPIMYRYSGGSPRQRTRFRRFIYDKYYKSQIGRIKAKQNFNKLKEVR